MGSSTTSQERKHVQQQRWLQEAAVDLRTHGCCTHAAPSLLPLRAWAAQRGANHRCSSMSVQQTPLLRHTQAYSAHACVCAATRAISDLLVCALGCSASAVTAREANRPAPLSNSTVPSLPAHCTASSNPRDNARHCFSCTTAQCLSSSGLLQQQSCSHQVVTHNVLVAFHHANCLSA